MSAETSAGPRGAPTPPEIRTQRLVLRRWRDSDLEPFARLNADPEVMEFCPAPLDRAASDAFVERIEQGFEENGFGLWAAQAPDGALIGFVGLARPRFEAPFLPAVEVGWRLARSAWGRGLASEGARAVVADGFERVGLEEIVSFTAEVNERSAAVMRRIGMTRDPAEDFDHPALPEGHWLRRHVLYRLGRDTWRAERG
jgi:RimJ/RimL family protein N-acetyltransferase